jgi:hypothetical protein
MSFYNTGNPVPSIDPRDLDDNAKHIDQIVNSADETFTDRLGAQRRTLAGVLSSATAAQDAAIAAQNAADAAQTAADMAAVIGKMYPTTAAGIAATPANGYFSVPSPEDAELLILYQNVAGVAVEIKRYPAVAAIELLQMVVDELVRRVAGVYGRTVPNTGLAVVDANSGKCLWTDGQGMTSTLKHDTRIQSILGVEQFPQEKLKAPGTTLAITGSDKTKPIVALRDDGWFDFARINAIELRVNGKTLNASVTSNPNDTYVRDGEVLNFYANTLSLSGWGSSSMERMASQFTAMTAELDPAASYYNGGKGGESSTHIAARLGSIPFNTTVPSGSIPASGGVTVTVSNANPSSSLKPFTGRLNGVYGTMTSTGSVFTFTRSGSGSAVPTVGPFPFIPEIGPQHRGDVVFLWMGKNDVPTYPAADIIQRTDTSYDWLSPMVSRCIVMGHFHNSDTLPASAEALTLDAVNAAYASRYGGLFVDVQAYLMSSQVWIDTGITPTAGDLTQQSQGQKPDSLSVDNEHLNDAMYVALNEKVLQPLIHARGWY